MMKGVDVMGKIFDNSGKNTENEIYDTSHRQYWAPPGHVAWKDNLIGFLGIILSMILVMLFDCFVLHPIPAPEGTFDIHGSRPRFVLAESGCEYADAKILSSNTTHPGSEVFLVEQDGEIHLIAFKESILFTRKLAGDLEITGDLPQRVKLRSGLTTFNMTIDENLRIRDTSSMSAGSHKVTLTVYGVLGFGIALCGSFILQKVKKSRK